jgi:hypothetical protein
LPEESYDSIRYGIGNKGRNEGAVYFSVEVFQGTSLERRPVGKVHVVKK